MCGRVIGYQFESPDAFYHDHALGNINQPYMDGISVTYGSPRTHIWTFAAAWTEQYLSANVRIYPLSLQEFTLGEISARPML